MREAQHVGSFRGRSLYTAGPRRVPWNGAPACGVGPVSGGPATGRSRARRAGPARRPRGLGDARAHISGDRLPYRIPHHRQRRRGRGGCQAAFLKAHRALARVRGAGRYGRGCSGSSPTRRGTAAVARGDASARRACRRGAGPGRRSRPRRGSCSRGGAGAELLGAVGRLRGGGRPRDGRPLLPRALGAETQPRSGCARGTVKSRHSRALARLREDLEEDGMSVLEQRLQRARSRAGLPAASRISRRARARVRPAVPVATGWPSRPPS